MPVFETDSLCRAYPDARAVDGITVSVEPGTALLVTGPSGSGKTTLLALLGALERPTSGRVAFASIDLVTASGAELARVRRRLGFVAQDFALMPGLTVLENLTYPLIPRGVPRAERQRRASEWLSRFQVRHKAGTRAGNLSGGEQQRVAIARAFVGQPEAILADEPTSNLDNEAADLLLAALSEYLSAGGTAVIASHDPRVIPIASARIQMLAGQLVKR